MSTLPALFVFAEAEAPRLTDEQKQHLIWLILFVFVAGATLIVVVVLMMRVWRRSLARLSAQRRQLAASIPDIWKAGGDRLIARMSPFPKADDSAPHAPYNEGDLHESDDDDPQDPPFLDDDEDDTSPRKPHG